MQKGLIGKKLGMTQLFDANGNVVPVTVIEAGPCVVAQKKTVENDGYDAVQVGYGDLKASKVNKPMKGHFAKNDVAPKKVLREFRLADCSSINVGDIIKADTFAEGDSVVVIAGVWKDTVSVVQKLDLNKQTVTIVIDMFGRETPVDVSIADVKKL